MIDDGDNNASRKLTLSRAAERDFFSSRRVACHFCNRPPEGFVFDGNVVQQAYYHAFVVVGKDRDTSFNYEWGRGVGVWSPYTHTELLRWLLQLGLLVGRPGPANCHRVRVFVSVFVFLLTIESHCIPLSFIA